jgi:hypothetical protein
MQHGSESMQGCLLYMQVGRHMLCTGAKHSLVRSWSQLQSCKHGAANGASCCVRPLQVLITPTFIQECRATS